MKIPLSYQFSESDCAPITFLNAFLYIFDRAITDSHMMKTIYQFALDLPEHNGVGGTSIAAIKQISDYLNIYSHENRLGFSCTFFTTDKVDLLNNTDAIKTLLNGGAIITTVCIIEGVYHYVLVVQIDEEFVYFFDSYFTEDMPIDTDIEIIDDQPTKYNRKVKIERFLDEKERFYSLGKLEKRKMVLVSKN